MGNRTNIAYNLHKDVKQSSQRDVNESYIKTILERIPNTDFSWNLIPDEICIVIFHWRPYVCPWGKMQALDRNF